MKTDKQGKRLPKYDKHGNTRPFIDRPFADELSEKEFRDEMLLAIWRMEYAQTELNKKLNQSKNILIFFCALTILNVIIYLIAAFSDTFFS